jgi:hypothetical protein
MLIDKALKKLLKNVLGQFHFDPSGKSIADEASLVETVVNFNCY